MGTKLYIKTYGCQMNEYDSQKTLEILKQDPTIEETSNPEEADIILLNTCSIREKAEEKVYSANNLPGSISISQSRLPTVS